MPPLLTHGHRLRAALSVLAVGWAVAPAAAQPNWSFTYGDAGTGYGFDDPSTGAARKATVTAVTNYMKTVFDARGTITFDWDQSANVGAAALAYAGSQYTALPDSRLLAGEVFLQAAKNNRTFFPGQPYHGQGQFNFNLGTANGQPLTWYTTTNQADAGGPTTFQYDLYSVALHELTHALGFASLIAPSGASEFAASGLPNAYAGFDRYLVRGTTGDPATATVLRRLLSADGGTFVGQTADLTSGQLYFDGRNAVAANGGNLVKLYAPGSFQEGSSVSHLDAAANLNGVMRPSIANGTARRAYTGVEIGMLLDLGWNNFQWDNTDGNWSAGAASVTASKWLNPAVHLPNSSGSDNTRRVLPPVGSITANLVLTFGGSGATGYTATNDLPANPFLVNRINLDSTSTQPNMIAGNPLRFGNDNGFDVNPRIEQRNTGGFQFQTDLTIAKPLVVTSGPGAPSGTLGEVTLNGKVSGAANTALLKSGQFGLYVNNPTNDYVGVTAMSAGTLGGVGRLGAGSALTVTGGTLDPGQTRFAIGTLTVDGSITLSSTAIYRPDVNGPGPTAHDRIRVTGANRTVNLGGATLQLNSEGYNLPANGTDRYFILSLEDPTSSVGTSRFADLPTTGSSFQFFNNTTVYISYEGDVASDSLSGGNDVVLSLTPVPEPATAVGLAAGGLGLAGLVRRRGRAA